MTTLDLKTLESALRVRAGELTRSLAERNEIVIERSPDAFDATLLAADEHSARALMQDFNLLRQVDAALDRIHDGGFGICLGCEEEIALDRLRVTPWAAYCVSCQANAEEDGTLDPKLARVA